MSNEALTADSLQHFTAASGLTVAQLAKRAGVDPSGLSKVARGEREASQTVAAKVNAAMAELAHEATADQEAADPPAVLDASSDPIERLRLAKDEHKTVKAWAANGNKGPQPPTPNIDAIQADGPVANRSKSRKVSAIRSAKATAPVRLYHDGKPMPDSQNKFSSMAWFFTKGCDPKHPDARLGTAALKALIEKAGGDVTSTKWKVKLSNGITLESRPETASQRKAS